jgi:RND family efflux transporter MFP subunit
MRSHLLIPTLAAALAFGCDRGEPGRVAEREGPIEVVVSPVGAAARNLGFPAEVVAIEEVDLATRTSGVVRRVTVDVGSPVRPGQLLVALESGDVAAGVDAAAAGARQARRYYERIAALEADGAATPQELDDARARAEAAEAGLRQARNQLGYVHLTAPIAGVVTERLVDPGDLAVPGQPALRIISTGGVEVRADLPAEQAGTVHEGSMVHVVIPETGDRVPAKVTRVVPALAGGSRRFRVEAAFASPQTAGQLLPGTYVRLEVEAPADDTRWIPIDALVRRGQLTGVYLVERDTLRLRWVRLGERRDEGVEVLAGISDDARIVRRPGPGLTDGQTAREVRSEPWRLRPLAEVGSVRAPASASAP